MTHLCVPIFVSSIEQAARDAALAAEHGADLVEFRVDELTDPAAIRAVAAATPVRCIITCRPVWEGGRSELPDSERLDLLQRSLECGAVYLDIELKAAAHSIVQKIFDLPRDGRPGIILSSHDFTTRPDRLYNILAELNQSPADIAKLVWTARTLRDNIEAFEILLARAKPTIALCMGEAGLLSRILAKKFGAFLTFASLSADTATAPGQVTIADIKRLYRWDAITPATKVYGVVGSPVAHSMSPAIHNAAFAEIGFDGVYVPLLVNESYESFKAFMESFLAFAPLHLSGLSITIPHKENALRYLQEKGAAIDPIAQSIGALNTIVVESSGFGVQGSGEKLEVRSEKREGLLSVVSGPLSVASGEPSAQSTTDNGQRTTDNKQLAMDNGQLTMNGFSTDYPAILDSITSALNIQRDDLKNYRIAILGAGGTGRTAVAALAHYGATIVIYNRTHERAVELAREFNGRTGKVVAAPLDKLCDSCCQIYLNTTSVGMHPHTDASPFGDAPPKLSADHLVFDTIYNPIENSLIQHARAQGAKTISGIEMFIRQAAGQFEAWTGQAAPTELMRRVVETRLRGN